MTRHKRKLTPVRRELHFAGYDFTSSPEGTIVHRERVDTTAPGDHGADPLGDGTFRMVPSGDVVDWDERQRRLARFHKNSDRREGEQHLIKELDLGARGQFRVTLTAASADAGPYYLGNRFEYWKRFGSSEHGPAGVAGSNAQREAYAKAYAALSGLMLIEPDEVRGWADVRYLVDLSAKAVQWAVARAKRQGTVNVREGDIELSANVKFLELAGKAGYTVD